MRYSGILLLAIIALLISSCSKKDQATNEELILKKWVLSNPDMVLDSSSQEDFIVFSQSTVKSVGTSNPKGGGLQVEASIEKHFHFLLSQENIDYKGYWDLDSNGLRLIAYHNKTESIDSAIFKTHDGNSFIKLFNENVSVVELENGIHQQEMDTIGVIIDHISANELQLSIAGKQYSFTSNTIALDGKISFQSVLRGFFGLLILLFIAFLFSSNRRAISWKTVGIGLAFQIILALLILKVPAVQYIFEAIGKAFVVILDFTRAGSEFLFSGIMDVNTYGFIFAFQVLPTIIFFAALTSLLFYLGIIQKIVYALAWVMTKAMKLSGAESLSVAGNIFLGQTESPLMIKAYLEKMNRSEILLVMIGGMATLAGGVLAAYIAFLGGDDPVQRLYFAKHLLTASFMAAPGAIVASKILMPQTEKIDETIEVSRDKIGSNVLDAISNGTTEGLKLAANVGAMLLVFVAFIAMANYILQDLFGAYTGLNDWAVRISDGQFSGLNLQFVLGYTFAPLMWAIGVAPEDITLVGRVLGEKIIMTEFIGYVSLAELRHAGAFASEKSIIMATYMLCGFANFASIGIQIGGIGTLAPGKRKWLSEFGIKALIGGSLASLLSATIVGMLMG